MEENMNYSTDEDIEDIDYEEVDDDEMEEEKSVSSGIIEFLGILSNWFIRVGVVVGIILFLYFIFTLQFLSVLLFAIGLVVAYFFGYFFMFCLDTFIDNN